jgi:hypothetical protein
MPELLEKDLIVIFPRSFLLPCGFEEFQKVIALLSAELDKGEALLAGKEKVDL